MVSQSGPGVRTVSERSKPHGRNLSSRVTSHSAKRAIGVRMAEIVHGWVSANRSTLSSSGVSMWRSSQEGTTRRGCRSVGLRDRFLEGPTLLPLALCGPALALPSPPTFQAPAPPVYARLGVLGRPRVAPKAGVAESPAPKGVLKRSDDLHVLSVDARPVTAEVVDSHPRGDGADGFRVDHPVRELRTPVSHKRPVATSVTASRPNQAVGVRLLRGPHS